MQPTTRAARRLVGSSGVLRPAWTTRPATQAQQSPPRWFSASKRHQSEESSAPPPPSEGTEGIEVPSTDIPWYLRVDVPRHPTLVPEEQALPAIPQGSPALLQPLLAFVHADLGLDALQLLDLRALDPPAALGPDLLMLFGTARSDRHLHVSADRLVRWLRGRGIHASADGLMGRNELKIKLRRKARRAKLMGTDRLDARARGGVDDGISTQWVCVHAGTQRVAAPAATTTTTEGASVDEQGRTTGFGRVRPGTTIVVQMLTDEKRQQLDLEALWTRALARSLRRQLADGEDIGAEGLAFLEGIKGLKEEEAAAAAEADDEFPDFPDADADDPLDNNKDEDAPTTLSPSSISWEQPQQPPQNPLDQQPRRAFSVLARRAFSTTAARPTTTTTTTTTTDDVVARLTQPQLSTTDLAWIESTLASDRTAKVRLLERLTGYLGGLKDDAEVLEALGGGGGGSSSSSGQPSTPSTPTPFLRAAHYCMEGLSGAETWAFRAWVHATMLALAPGHGAYTLDGMGALVREMEQSGVPVSRELGAHLLKGLFSVRAADRGGPVRAKQAEVALQLLNCLHERGETVLSNDFLVPAIASLARSSSEPVSQRAPEGSSTATATATGDALAGVDKMPADAAVAATLGLERDPSLATGPSVEVADWAAAALAKEAQAVDRGDRGDRGGGSSPQSALEDLLHRHAGLPCPDDAALQQLLRAYALQGDWPRFWAAWETPAQHGRRRGELLYICLFQTLAQTQHRALCTDALRARVPEMLAEQPAVAPVGSVRAALWACVAVADPHAVAASRDGAQSERMANREMVKLLRELKD